ncbi:MAG: hypothetical protein D6806_02780 [Deltaproteobacteria bacterium]|nr:MAG: hypothetical protein D6806_02780 [Deltaproteobacteria bacterium]
MKTLGIRVVFLFAFAAACTALAQEGQGPAPAAGASVIDEVVLKDGSRYRGTIVEAVQGDYVIIRTLSGKNLSFSVSDLSYYGPVRAGVQAERPRKAVSVVTSAVPRLKMEVKGPSYPVRFTSKQEGLTFMLHTHSVNGVGWGVGVGPVFTSTKGYTRICSAPCEAEIPRGRYRLGVSMGDTTVEAGEVDINGPLTIEGQYKDNSRIRAAGWITFLLTLAAGTAMAAASVDSEGNLDSGLLGAGTAIMLGGGVAGVAMVLWPDDGELKVSGYR